MHIHLPKPLHGWRALVGEVGIIVLGVLIALAAEAVVEHLQWEHKVSVVRKSIMGELGNDRARWDVDVAAAHCADTDIDKLDAWASAGAPGPNPVVRNISTFHFFWMHSANWNLATGSQSLDHFPIEDQLAFAALYDGIAHRQHDLELTQSMVGRVQTLVPLATDAQGQRDLRQALGDLKFRMHVLTANDDYMKRHFDALHVQPNTSDFAADLAVAHCVADG
ncbi:MAG TPA: hypothetical protein VG407_11095 [Caulobacteraceae bacterium]|jgi:hypothetical protein|nr:hypothetical protein [Caulobacteraceae bacterium]